MKKTGFTLLEILIAVMLFTTGIIVVVWLFSEALISTSDAENTTIAMNLAQKRMEEIRNLDFDTGIVSVPRAAVDIDVDNDGVNDFPGFQRQVVVVNPPGAPTTNDLKQVTVTVYWTYKGDDISVPLETYISRN